MTLSKKWNLARIEAYRAQNVTFRPEPCVETLYGDEPVFMKAARQHMDKKRLHLQSSVVPELGVVEAGHTNFHRIKGAGDAVRPIMLCRVGRPVVRANFDSNTRVTYVSKN